MFILQAEFTALFQQRRQLLTSEHGRGRQNHGINGILHLFTSFYIVLHLLTFDIRRPFRTALMTLFNFVKSLWALGFLWKIVITAIVQLSFVLVRRKPHGIGLEFGANSPIMRLRFWGKEMGSKRTSEQSESSLLKIRVWTLWTPGRMKSRPVLDIHGLRRLAWRLNSECNPDTVCIFIYIYYIVVYSIMLCYIVSYHIISYHIIISYYIISYYIYHILLYYIILYDIIWYYIILCYIILYYTKSYHIILYYMISYHIISYYIILCYIIYIRMIMYEYI